MIESIIIDDEKGSRKSLANFLKKYFSDDIEIIGEADSVHSGLKLLNSTYCDLLFLDIELQDGTGFHILEQVDSKDFQVIFITAYDEYAIRAFRFSAIDYLLKPINLEELEEAIYKVKNNKKQLPKSQWQPLINNLLEFSHENPSITVNTEKSIEFIPVSDIIHLESSSSYTTFYMRSGKKIVSSKTLKVYENLLVDYNFFRCHQSHLINMADVKRYLRKDGGIVELKDGSFIPISRRRKDSFFKMVKSS